MSPRDPPPPPPLDYDGLGKARTGAIRIRPTWFGLFIIEEQIEEVRSHTIYWQRLKRPCFLKEIMP
jgi:hypothetical protein